MDGSIITQSFFVFRSLCFLRCSACLAIGTWAALFGASRRKPLSPQLKARLDRLSVIWCVRDGRPFEALKDVGHKLLLSEFAPEYAASDISHGTLDKSSRPSTMTRRLPSLPSRNEHATRSRRWDTPGLSAACS